MKKPDQKRVMLIALALTLFLLAGIAWAMSPIPVCFQTAAGVCSIVTPSNPLPTVNM